MGNTRSLIIANIITCAILAALVSGKPPAQKRPETKAAIILNTTPDDPPKQYQIANKIPGHLTYDKIVSQIKEWNKQCPEITETGTYGKTSKNSDIWFIRTHAFPNSKLISSEITRGLVEIQKPKVLITACIHGNEWGSNAVMMGILGTMLSEYGRSKEITDLLKERDVYWVPVVSPDSYQAGSRYADGVDPNRNFPWVGQPNVNSIPPIAALRNFFLQNGFKAVISCHTYGSYFLYPHGYTQQPSPDDAQFRQLTGKMSQLSGYQSMQTRFLRTAPPYHGFEVDWYYANGAFSLVCEIGKSHMPPESSIPQEVAKTYQAFMTFIKEAPIIELKNKY